MFKFSFLLILLTLITSLIFFVQGEQIFYHLTNQKSSLSSVLLLSILFISFMQYSIQYWKELFQSVNKTIIMLLILSIELFLSILIYSYFDGVNLVQSCLEKKYILIIDDWNWLQVRLGTENSIQQLGFKVLYKEEIFTKGEDPNDFWNGLGIFVIDKGVLNRI